MLGEYDVEEIMQLAKIRGVNIHYKVFGNEGPWVALSPGGRRGMEELFPIAKLLADRKFRVLLHDRRNCGASDASIAGEGAEYEIWADDLYWLLKQLNALPAFVGGSSSGCRLSVLLAIRHPEAVKGLLLWRLTGGGRASERLVEKYYGMYKNAALHGGMEAVCETGDFKELIAARSNNRKLILDMDVDDFVSTMDRWSQYFLDGAHLPIIGATEADLRALDIAACVIPGNDKSHPRAVGEEVARLLPGAQLNSLGIEDRDLDVAPMEEWDEKDPAIAEILISFMNSVNASVEA